MYGPKTVLHLALQPQVCGLEIRGELPIRGEFPPEFEPHETKDMPVEEEGHAEEYDLPQEDPCLPLALVSESHPVTDASGTSWRDRPRSSRPASSSAGVQPWSILDEGRLRGLRVAQAFLRIEDSMVFISG